MLDDELPGLTYLKLLCEQLPALDVLKVYDNPQKFLLEIQNIDFDLCIMDIEMPEINGLQVAGLLKNKLIIFTTAYREYAADAFDINAIDYIRKPVQKERLEQAIAKAVDRYKSTTSPKDFAQFNTDKGKMLIHFDKLAYITTSETDGRDKIAMFLDGSSVTLKNISFENLSKVLPASYFFRINKKAIISFRIIVSYTYDEIITSLNDHNSKALKFPLSEVYRSQFLKFANPSL